MNGDVESDAGDALAEAAAAQRLRLEKMGESPIATDASGQARTSVWANPEDHLFGRSSFSVAGTQLESHDSPVVLFEGSASIAGPEPEPEPLRPEPEPEPDPELDPEPELEPEPEPM